MTVGTPCASASTRRGTGVRTTRLESFEIEAQEFGQPRVGWTAGCVDLRVGGHREVRGHVQIRWSHGRFRQRPEAKVYLDTPHVDVPGYNPL